ncbi:hypothetical protein DCAR_0312442 [Daucus carota subsp. sativus]|uniref:Uncharacterized protein n=1 Tax=Daucus carota subsp. sativus TaxID=79200 RepID=A0A161WU16_DAUCS|nr:hypothetical protein DCAR_0312442 [Daucus carota subsp. sativus]
MRSSSCIAGCLDVENPRLIRLHQWAEEDREFLRMVSNSYKTKGDSPMNPKQQELRQLEKSVSLDPIIYMSSPSPLISIVPSPGRDYACRQRYLRSYTLDANYNNKPKQMMSPAQRAKNWFLRKEKKQTTKSTDCNSFFRAASSLFICMNIKFNLHE